MSKEAVQARVNPFLYRKIRWIIENDDFNMAQIVREGVRLFIEQYEKSSGKNVPLVDNSGGLPK